MRKKTYKHLSIALIAIVVVVNICVFLPLLAWLLLLWLVLGTIDVLRNRPVTAQLLKEYFISKGLLTFLLAPINLLADLCCYRNRKVYQISDYPEAWQVEIKQLLRSFDQHGDAIIKELNSRLEHRKRGMIFYKWYNKNYDDSIPCFQQQYRYIKSIGVSVFNKQESTSWHFGPMRFTLRILYNLRPTDSDDAFIETQGKKHLWRHQPVFSFDDTLFHRSVNETDDLRYCAFIDIVRPSPIPVFMDAGVRMVGFFMMSMRGIFYKNWDML